jgi:hypothetical protein
VQKQIGRMPSPHPSPGVGPVDLIEKQAFDRAWRSENEGVTPENGIKSTGPVPGEGENAELFLHNPKVNDG